MSKKSFLQDLVKLWLLLTVCVIGGLILNEMRPKPLAIFYSPPSSHLNNASSAPVNPADDVTAAEMEKISSNHAALILDARPEIFYRLGHIPSALSLPRDDFENQYQALQSTLQSHKGDPVIVYCSSMECHDSQMVVDSLSSLGFAHVRLFRGGWNDWETADLPVEKEGP